MKTAPLICTVVCGAIASTMLIGNIFFKAEFGYIPFIFVLFQVIFLILTNNTEE